MVIGLLIFCILMALGVIIVGARETKREKTITVQHFRPFVERGLAAELEEEQNPCAREDDECSCPDMGRLVVLADVPRAGSVAALLP
jgi:hypothetical protein